MSEDLGTTIWRLQETVRVAKLAATHRLGQMRSLLMHERHKVWKREFGFDRIEMATEMDEKRSRIRTSPLPNPFFDRSMVIPDHPHTPEAFSLQMKMDVEGLGVEIILSQPPLSECDTSPRRAAVDTGSEEPGTPPQPPAISTGSGPVGFFFSFKASRDMFFAFKLHKTGAGVYFDTIKGGVCIAASSTRSRDGRQQQRHHFTSRHPRGVCKTTNWPAAKDESVVNRPKQAVR